MKRVVIYNLKECFESGMTFKDLAEFEKRVQDDKNFMGEIPIGIGVFTFSQAKIDKNGRFTLYYDFKTVF
jgi:hypothetical protein